MPNSVSVRHFPAVINMLAFTQSSSTNVAIAGVAGSVIRVWGCSVGGTSDPIVTLKSSGGTVLWGPSTMSSTGNPFIIYTPTGEFRRTSAFPFVETLVGEGLQIDISGGGTLGGKIDYEIAVPIPTGING